MASAITTRVKICGVNSQAALQAASEHGATYVGLVFYPSSPRAVTKDEAIALSAAAPVGLCKVGLFVDPDDDFLDQTLQSVPLDMIQLHGGETPERVSAIRQQFGLPVMKAVRIENSGDVGKIQSYEHVADQILCDAKPRAEGELPGGNGVAFDWRLIVGRRWRAPWMLAGGLNPENVAQAIALTGADQIDVSSGVESAPGRKDPMLIKAFVEAASENIKKELRA